MGELRGNEWNDKDGKKHYDLELLANDLQVSFAHKAEAKQEAFISVDEDLAQEN